MRFLFVFFVFTKLALASEGTVKYFWHSQATTDQFTTSQAWQPWIADNVSQMLVYSPFFDSYLSAFPKAAAYIDGYAIYNALFYPGSAVNSANSAQYIIKDVNGKNLFINYDCNKNGSGQCSQYAANVASLAYVNFFISEVQALASRGYREVFIDDVNLDVSTLSDGSGKPTLPVDPATNQAMTKVAWANYFAQFLAKVKAANSSVTMIHNSRWFADPSAKRWNDASVTQEIKQADFINIERGVNDAGLTGGTSYWSLSSLFSFIDYVHSLQKAVVFDVEGAGDGVAREYSLAAYLLISQGNDVLGNDAILPTQWWNGYSLDLGRAKSERYQWSNLYRRDFEGGVVLLNEPQGVTRTISFPDYHKIDGSGGANLTLSAAQGVILIK